MQSSIYHTIPHEHTKYTTRIPHVLHATYKPNTLPRPSTYCTILYPLPKPLPVPVWQGDRPAAPRTGSSWAAWRRSRARARARRARTGRRPTAAHASAPPRRPCSPAQHARPCSPSWAPPAWRAASGWGCRRPSAGTRTARGWPGCWRRWRCRHCLGPGRRRAAGRSWPSWTRRATARWRTASRRCAPRSGSPPPATGEGEKRGSEKFKTYKKVNMVLNVHRNHKAY